LPINQFRDGYRCDFLDDRWEDKYLGGVGGDASVDSDGDRLSNEGEFRFGSNPLDPDDAGGVLLEYTPTAGSGLLRIKYREREEPWFDYELVHSPNWSGWGGALGVVGSRVEYPGGWRTRVLDVETSPYDPSLPHFFRVSASRR